MAGPPGISHRHGDIQTEAINEKNRLLAWAVVAKAANLPCQQSHDPIYRTLAASIARVLEECGDLMERLAESLDCRINAERFGAMADELFEAGDIRWERLVVLFAFASVLTRRLTGGADEAAGVAKLLAAYLDGTAVTSWIIAQGGWETFREEFRCQDEVPATERTAQDNRWKSLLLLSGLGLGLGIAATFHKLSH